MNNILITGANGQLGSEMHFLASDKCNYIFTDITELDITNLQSVQEYIQEYKISVVVNCAAYTNVEKAENDLELADTINHKAVENLAISCKNTGATLIHISTDYVFQGDKNRPYNEEDDTSPLGVYGRTKLAGENVIKKIGCRYLIFRTAWLYSTYGNNFVKTICKLTSERRQLTVVFDQVGTPTYAADLAGLIYYVIENQKYIENQGVYHFSNEGVCSWYDFAKEITTLSGNSCDILPCHSIDFPTKVKRPIFSVLDKSKVKRDFDYKIPYWRDSLCRYFHKLKQEN